MGENNKVFSSEITRAQTPIKNNLNELIDVVPATPATVSHAENVETNFTPKSGKQYVPKKRNKIKVKTVRDIRTVYEEDVMLYLPEDIEKQQRFLLRKIKEGLSRDPHTKATAKKIMRCGKSLSRSALQMLMNINPEDRAHNMQYVLYNGKPIRVNGSTGGENKFLIDLDLSKKTIPSNKKRNQAVVNKKKGLLRNSLSVKFKPGPLTKKNNLDDSYQQYNVGRIELVDLPTAGLSLKPTLGVVLEPSISNFVQNLRDEDGTISKKWAEFSVSVLRSARNANENHDQNEHVTFSLEYKCNQKRILMRRDVASKTIKQEDVSMIPTSDEPIPPNRESSTEIQSMVSKMLDAVEISLIQDEVYSKEDMLGINCHEESVKTSTNMASTILSKEKKKRRFGELDKLDVTVIQLPSEMSEENNGICQNSFCSLGCICASLQNPYCIKQHCGRAECMFECKCDFSYYATGSFENSNLIPGIVNLDKEINSKLTKEEQKFHQTVIVTGDKGVLLKSQKRNWKTPKRYADFYTSMPLKTDKTVRNASIALVKLPCENIEPWCMVHKLYKCFCKGRFMETAALVEDKDVNVTTEHHAEVKVVADLSHSVNSRNRTKRDVMLVTKPDHSWDMPEFSFEPDLSQDRLCARLMAYKRKYANSYYLSMNRKVMEMEKNDESLRKRLQQIVSVQDLLKTNNSELNKQITVHEQELDNKLLSEEKECLLSKQGTQDHEPVQKKMRNSEPVEKNVRNHDESLDSRCLAQRSLLKTRTVEELQNESTNYVNPEKNFKPPHINPTKDRTKLVAWLESSYQQYKRRKDQGKIILEPPKNKKMVIYPWDFILSRYKERKNIFLVTKNMPFRLFMAVDTRHNFFKNCINLRDIHASEIHKYPITIQRLLTSATNFEDKFCILCGLPWCWEFVGALSKIGERNIRCSTSSDDSLNSTNHCGIPEYEEKLTGEQDKHQTEDSEKICKWLVLTVESDFSEIQFTGRGFFVKHDSIIKAANVARLSGKTVRLSSHKTSDQNEGPQFGIYAIPHAHEYCVFIGPYQNNDSPGIEIMKSKKFGSQPKLSKGYWLTTKKEDIYKVIDDPLSFLPLETDSLQPVTLEKPFEAIPLTSYQSTVNAVVKNNLKDATYVPHILGSDPQEKQPTEKNLASSPKTTLPTQKKQIRSITVLKRNCIVPVPQVRYITKVNDQQNTSKIASGLPPVVGQVIAPPKVKFPTILSASRTMSSKVVTVLPPEKRKPIAEIAPQIKIVDVYSQSNDQSNRTPNTNTGRGMFVLKPEEINKRVMKDVTLNDSTSDNGPRTHTSDLDLDIENFLATSHVYVPSNADSLIEPEEEDPDIKDVFIECITVENLGWVQGKINAEKHLSFKFPGFAYTKFYPELEAFSKINGVLSRKVYVPSTLDLEWHVVESEEQLKSKVMLKPEQLGIDFVLTRRGLRHRSDVITYAKTLKDQTSVSSASATYLPASEVDKATDLLVEAEDEIQEIENTSRRLLQEFSTGLTESTFDEFTSTSSGLSNTQRDKIAERLKGLLSSVDDQ